MTFEFIQGKNFAIQVLEDALRSKSSREGSAAPVESAIKNLAENAASKPKEYAKGIMWVVEKVRKAI